MSHHVPELAGPVAGHDAARAGALGAAVASLLALLDGPRTTAALAERAQITPRAVRKHLATLRDHGLVTTSKRVHTAADGLLERLDEVAERCGTAGQGAAQKERHHAEREARVRLAEIEVEHAEIAVVRRRHRRQSTRRNLHPATVILDGIANAQEKAQELPETLAKGSAPPRDDLATQAA